MAELNDAQREELAEIRRRFAHKLPDKLRELDQIARLLPSRADASDLEHLHHEAHRLAGSAAIFGFGEIAEAAGELERLLDARPASPAAGATWAGTVVAATRRLRRAARPARPSRPKRR